MVEPSLCKQRAEKRPEIWELRDNDRKGRQKSWRGGYAGSRHVDKFYGAYRPLQNTQFNQKWPFSLLRELKEYAEYEAQRSEAAAAAA